MPSILPIFTAALLISTPVFASEFVPVSNFRAVELQGGGSVDVVPGPAERVTILEGSSQFTQMRVDNDGKLIIRTCNERCPRGYRLHVEIQSRRVPALGVDGGGVILVHASFAPQSHLSAGVNGGGRIDARALDAATVSAAVNGGGEVLVHPRGALSAAVNGGGHIRYWGNPATSVAIRGGGGVTRAD